MAVIGRIRKHSTLLLVIIGLALLAFIMGDFVRKSSHGPSMLGEIDGEDITYTDFFNRVAEQEDIYKRNTGKEELTPEESFQLKNMVWETILQEYLLGKEYAKLGIEVTDEEMDDMIKGRNPHPIIQQIFKDPETGAFNPAFVEQFIANKDKARPEEQKFFDQVVKEIKKERLNNKYTYLVAKSYYLPKAIAKTMFEEAYTSRNIRVVQANYQTIPDNTITLTDEDYQKWYDEHKNYFKQETSVDAEYVIFDIIPTPADLEEIKVNVASMYEEFKAHENPAAFVSTLPDSKYDSSYFKKGMLPLGFDTLVFNMNEGSYIEPFEENNSYYFGKILKVTSRPDSIKASQLLIQFKDARGAKTERTKEQAKAIIDSLLIASKKPNFSFEAAVINMSEYPTAKKDTGNLQWMVDGDLNYQLFFDSAITINVNNYRIVESALGYHLLKVTEKTTPLKKIQIAIGKKLIEPSESTIQDVYTKANKLSGENETIEKFNKAITEGGLNKRMAENVTKMQYTIPGVQNGREIVRWFFDKKVEVGQVSQVFDIDGKYVVAALKTQKDEGFAKLEDVKKMIEPLVKRDKKAVKIIDNINKINPKEINAIATNLQTTVDSLPNVVFASYNFGRYGPEPSVIGRISTLKQGTISKPLKGEMGVYVVFVDQINPAPKTEDYKFVGMQMAAMFSQRVQNGLFEAIKEKAKVKDNRIFFY